MAGRLLFVILMYSFHKIQTQAQRQPKLIVTSPVITETETVTLDCQTPSSVRVHQCYFQTVGKGNAKDFPCLQTLTGTELLKMSQQRSPAEVQVKCYYTVKLGDIYTPSLHSDTSSITIHSQTALLSLHIGDGYVLFTCSLPGSANYDTRCNLYFGEASHPVKTATVWKKKSSANRWFCQFIVTIEDLLRHPHFFRSSDASCDYSLGSEPNSLSPRSDRYRLNAGLTVSTPHASAPVTSESPVTSGWTVGTSSNTVSLISTFLTSVKPASAHTKVMTPVNPESGDKIKAETWILKFAAVVAGCGVTVGVILLVSARLCNKRRTGAGSEDVKRGRLAEKENLDTYHLYCTVSEEPAASALKGMVYSTVQQH